MKTKETAVRKSATNKKHNGMDRAKSISLSGGRGGSGQLSFYPDRWSAGTTHCDICKGQERHAAACRCVF